MKYILSIDVGDLSVKSALMDEKGGIVCAIQKSLCPIHPFHGQIELDPEEIFNKVKEAIVDVIEQSEIAKVDIVCLGIATTRDTVIVWNKETTKPLWNAITKNDTRTSDSCTSLKIHESSILEKTGVPLSTYGPAPKIRWILDQVKDVNLDHCLFGGLNTWILWRLTKGSSFITDMSNISKSLLFNIHTQTWDDELIKIFGIQKSILPKIESSNEIFGYVDVDFFGIKIPICSMVSDSGGAMFAAGCTKKGDLHLHAGASAFLLMNTGNCPQKSKNHLMNTVGLSLKNKPPLYFLEGMIPSTGSVIQWLESHLGIIRSAKEVEGLAYSVPDSLGVYFAPVQGKRMEASLLGLSLSSNIGHICRAVLEGIALLIRDSFEGYNDVSTSKITCSGGMVENIFFVQICSDLLGRTIVRPKEIKLPLLGAAYLAGLTLGVFKDQEEIRKLFSSDREFTPSLKEKDKDAMIKNWIKAVSAAVF